MPIVRREDGVQFAIHTYRELLSARRISLLKNEIRILAQSHGEFVRVFKQDGGQVEAIFSRDPGYLLGESVWRHLGKPSDVVYCEALPDGNQALVVIVRSGIVYLDARVPFANIADEFAPLLAGANRYEIYLYGDVPVSDKDEDGDFVFPQEMVKSFQVLPSSLFEDLTPGNELELQPLEIALRSDVLKETSKLRAAVFLVILLLILGWGYYLWSGEEEVQPKPVVQRPVIIKPPEDTYSKALETPAPDKILDKMVMVLGFAITAPGWNPVSISYDGNKYVITYTNDGGTFTGLQHWVESRRYTMTMDQTGVSVIVPRALPLRRAPFPNFRDMDSVVAKIADQINFLLMDKSVVMSVPQTDNGTYKIPLTFALRQASPLVLQLIGRVLQGLPVKLDTITLSIAQGQLSGTITLTVLGK